MARCSLDKTGILKLFSQPFHVCLKTADLPDQTIVLPLHIDHFIQQENEFTKLRDSVNLQTSLFKLRHEFKGTELRQVLEVVSLRL